MEERRSSVSQVGSRTVKKRYAPDFPGSKLYFTEADPSAQEIYGISFGVFELKIKLWLLLSDFTIFSTGHMLQSPLTFSWISQNKAILSEFVRENAILPSLREDREGFKEYVIKHPEQEDQPTLLKVQKKELLERAALLSDLFQTAVSWPAVEESHWFRDSFVRDLTEKNSPLRKRMVGVSNRAIESLSKNVASCKFLSRENLRALIRTYCPERERLLLRYGDIFYYLSGASFKDAFPLLHPNAASLCREKVSFAAQSTFPTQEKELWREIINAWGVTSQALEKLPLTEIIKIRRDSLGRRLRKTWGTLLEEARRTSVKKESISNFEHVKNELVNLFRTEVLRQKKKYHRFIKIRTIVEIGSWVTSGLVTFCLTGNPVLSAAAGYLGLISGKPVLDAFEKTRKTEMVVLATRIQQRVAK